MPLRSFPPVAGRGARALILGSMPGAASLAAGQYYAHPRNSFWPVILAVLGAGRPLPYRARLRLLKANGFALWDVLRSCERRGSSDSAISAETPNDFAAFFRARPGIRTVFFNGSKAWDSYRKSVLPSLPPGLRGLEYVRLPSTSPAHAALSRGRKLAVWRKALLAVARRGTILGK